MLDKTINSALLTLRAQIIRGDGKGQDHVEAMLRSRGIDPQTCIVRAKRKADAARKGLMRVIVLDALRGGPKTLRELAQIVAARRPEIGQEAAYQRTGQVLARMKRAVSVVREGRLWALNQPAPC